MADGNSKKHATHSQRYHFANTHNFNKPKGEKGRFICVESTTSLSKSRRETNVTASLTYLKTRSIKEEPQWNI
jgi:hypothetical protein